MEELTQEQKILFDKFIKALKDKQSMSSLQTLFSLLEENKIQDIVNKINEINQAYNGNKEKDSMSIKELREDIETIQKRLDEIFWKIFQKNENGDVESQALIDIQDAHNKAKKMQESYQRFYDMQDSQGNITQGIITKLTEACQQIEQNKDKIAKLQNFYTEVFEGITENGKITRQPLNEILNSHISQLRKLFLDKKKELEQLKEEKDEELTNLYEAKEKEINELLPSATSAGLSVAYRDEKVDIQKNITWWHKIFVGSIIVFIGVFALYFYLSFQENFNYMSFLKSLPFWIFSGFFTFYSTKQIAEYKRIASEYAYKERLNETYAGYERQIEKMQNEELKTKLIEIILDSAMFNPSDTLNSKGEIPSMSMLEKTIDTLPLDILKKIYEKIGNKLKDKQ
ncbi:hypothetical protein [Helicobacter rodentium]|uniref:hypothetical protein n=3 Tax=Helicobacter rodentium TaxID=59617 RepID=UPI0023F0948D|nr:hypothetical protein [Helicobacter rodentium]